MAMTSRVSQSIGAPAASKIFITESEISGPIPSPGIMVTSLFSDRLREVERARLKFRENMVKKRFLSEKLEKFNLENIDLF